MLVWSLSIAGDTISWNMKGTFCLLVLCGAIFAQSPPSITLHPVDAVVKQQGAIHMFHCNATNAVMIRWSHNGRVFVPDDGRQLLPNNSLRIINVDVSTTGLYACRATNNVGTVTSRPASLQLAWLNGTVQQTQPVLKRLAGDTLELSCGDYNSLPAATVTWSKRDGLNLQSPNLGDNVVSSVRPGTLYFRSLASSHSGIYQCLVTNSMTTNNLQRTYTLEVNNTQTIHPEPKVASPPSGVVVNSGDTASFQCITVGSPLPTINWSRIVQGNDNLLADNIRQNSVNFVLSVVNVQPADAGDYICNASNGVGQLVASLRIRDAPVLISIPANNTHSVRFGDDLQLSCLANGTLFDSLTWYRNGVQLESSDHVLLEPLGRLIIRNTSTVRDSGVFQCYAENAAGFASHDVLVDVFTVPPSFTLGLRDTVVFEGDPLVLRCQAVGAPPPSYTWHRGSITLDNTNGYDTSVPGMLKTTDVSRDQGGMYNCSVFSVDNGISVGRNSSSARVFVIHPTVFVATAARQLAKQAGYNITLPCSVTSDQSTTVSYSWIHDDQLVLLDQRVTINNGDLFISVLRSNDAGRYTCVVNTRVNASLDAQPRVLYSNVSILTVSGNPVPPGRPVITAIEQTSVLVEWPYDGDSRLISHFEVERREFGVSDWTTVATVGALNTTQVNSSNLFPFTTYQFRVLSVNSNDVSSPSLESELVVTREAAPTTKPLNVKATENNYTAIVIVWEHPPLRLADGSGRNGIIVSYEVTYTPVGGSEDTTVRINTINNLTMLTITGLEQRQVYRVSVAAINSQGKGPATVLRLPTMGAVTVTEDDEKFHEQSWFIVVMVLVAVAIVGCIVIMAACVVRSARHNKSHEGKYNVEGIKDGHITTGVLNKDVVEDYENRRSAHLMKYSHSLSKQYRSNASLITDNVTVETQSNAASTLPAPPYIPPPSFDSVGHVSSLSTIDRPVVSRGGSSWNNFVIAESDVFEEACSSIEKPPLESDSDECDGQHSSVSTSNKCATFV